MHNICTPTLDLAVINWKYGVRERSCSVTDLKVGHGSPLNEAAANDAIIQSEEQKHFNNERQVREPSEVRV